VLCEILWFKHLILTSEDTKGITKEHGGLYGQTPNTDDLLFFAYKYLVVKCGEWFLKVSG
jgi:hypothetical protein